MSKIDLQLIQDNYTNFILYDNSNRGYNPSSWTSFEDVKKIKKILLTFTNNSTFLENDFIVEIASADNISPEGTYDNQIIFDFSSMVFQEDFKIIISYSIFGEELLDQENLLQEGLWEVKFEIDDNTIQTEILKEYTFKQTEIYRDKLFLYNARNIGIYNPYYSSYKTKEDKFRMQILWFDANFKAFKTQLESGNMTFANITLKWLKDFQLYNPIDKILETND